MGVKNLPDEIVTDLDPSIQINLANSIISESPKFINLGLLNFDAIGKLNINFTPSTRSKSLNGTQRDNFKSDWLASAHGFERVRKTTACSNHINNYELETREVFERETENIPLTPQINLVTPLHDNPLKQSTDSLTMMVLGLGSPLVHAFTRLSNYPLIVLVNCNVIESPNPFVVSVEYLQFPAQKLL